MPSHQTRVASAPLPKEYQFGDAKPTPTEFDYWIATEQRRAETVRLAQQVTGTDFK